MTYDLKVETRNGYLFANVTGENSVETKNAYLTELREVCRREKIVNLLVEEDLAGPSLETADIYQIVSTRSEYAAQFFRRIAYVNVNATQRQPDNQFVENLAVNRGLTMKVFATVKEAQEWLEEGIRRDASQ